VPKKEKGKSHSTRPLSKRAPRWFRYAPEEVEALVVRLAKEGNPPSKIGIILRDQYGIPLVKVATGKNINEILKKNNLAPSLPEDLEVLLRKAARLRIHVEKHKADKYNKRAILLVESKIHRLSEYYKRKGILPQDWKYTPLALSIT